MKCVSSTHILRAGQEHGFLAAEYIKRIAAELELNFVFRAVEKPSLLESSGLLPA